ncbi:class I SAM-dependent methyltransferase [Thermoflexus sp.]|uniref:class I SAM-dependent methyltransferase n=1 Tax=Thermoflexus sp. TaxID=1969742 RepID=UPI0025E5F3EF|nr:class I SAM-dependent methyltransferase [Thermoflexus sp.]MCS7350064.1 methyltransferase domain-containing protein [Thermoflexus sp.]MDW8179513.1 methyltransferase domain-containing protein [Anaerolineae bacterium]
MARSRKPQEDPIEAYNRLQREYLGRRIQSTMYPKRTPYVLRRIEEVIRFGEFQPGERVLDVRCGMGRHAFLLVERGFQVEGLDLSPFLIERMREFDGGRYNIPVYCADIHQPPEELYGRYDA